jgi:hypothetical protein
MAVYPRNANASTYTYVDPKPSPWKYAQSGGDGTIVIVSESWTVPSVYPPVFTQEVWKYATPTQGIRYFVPPKTECDNNVNARFPQMGSSPVYYW